MIGAAVFIGMFHVWAAPSIMNEDGIAYLDLGDAWLRADWPTSVNAFWSPLYAWILAAALKVSGNSLRNELAAAHLVNGILYLAALWAFVLLLREVLTLSRCDASHRGQHPALSEWAWTSIGLGLFVWTSLVLITVEALTPDMSGAALIYVAAYNLLRVRRTGRPTTALALGAVCGMGYLARTALLPIGLIFIALSAGPWRFSRVGAKNASLACAVLLLVSVPLALVLSVQQGRLTIGEAGRLNYAWFVNGVSIVHWQGENPRSGVPVHPTRRLQLQPAIYHFPDPRPISYPITFDKARWFEGLKLRFDATEQWHAIVANLRRYARLTVEHPEVLGVIIGLSAIAAGSYSIRSDVIVVIWPALGGLLMYSLVYVEYRYIAPFIVLLAIGTLAAAGPLRSVRGRRAVSVGTAVILVSLTGGITRSALTAVRIAGSDLPIAWEQYVVADALKNEHLRPRASVARIGTSMGAYWARLAGVQIAAELPDAERFWASSAVAQRQALRLLGDDGIAAIVAFHVPAPANTEGWRRIGATTHFLYVP